MSDLTSMHEELLETKKEMDKKIAYLDDIIEKKAGPKGEPGPKMTTTEIEEIVLPLLPTKEDLVALIKPLIPEVEDGEDGEAPSQDDLLDLITPLIPKTPEPINEKKVKTMIAGMMPTIDHNKIAERVKAILPPPSEQAAITEETFREFIDSLPEGTSLFKTDHITGLDETLTAVKDQVGRKGYVHGGGDTVVAGTNVSIVKDANGKSIISTLAGGVTILPATGAINDSNLAFTFTKLPTLLCINGGFYQQTGGSITWTWNAGSLTATLSSVVGTGGSIFGTA